MTIVWQLFLCFCFVTTATIWIIGIPILKWIHLMTKKWVEHDKEIEEVAKALTEVIKWQRYDMRKSHETYFGRTNSRIKKEREI